MFTYIAAHCPKGLNQAEHRREKTRLSSEFYQLPKEERARYSASERESSEGPRETVDEVDRYSVSIGNKLWGAVICSTAFEAGGGVQGAYCALA